MAKKQEVDIEAAIREVEEIVSWFENSEIDLNEALNKYRKGLKKIKEIENYLKQAKIEVEKIEKEFGA